MTFTQKLNLMRFHPQSLVQLKMMMPNTLPVSDLELHHSRGNGSSCCSTEAIPISSYVCTSKRYWTDISPSNLKPCVFKPPWR